MKWLQLLFSHFLSAPLVSLSGGDGMSLQDAIIIKSQDHDAGVWAEYKYMTDKFGRRNVDWRLSITILCEKDDRRYDVNKIELKNGKEVTLYFDITNLHGTIL